MTLIIDNPKERRLILIADVMRPEYINRQNRVCANVLASSVLQMLYQRFPFFNHRTGYIKKTLYTILRILILGILPVQRTFK